MSEDYKERGYHSKTEMKHIECLKDARIKELKDLHTSMDAKIWAKEFWRLFGNSKDRIDEELIFSWFSNAIMCGFDHANQRSFEKNKELEEQNKILREELSSAARRLDGIKFDLYASVYTLTDDEFETVFSVRDSIQQALARVSGKDGAERET